MLHRSYIIEVSLLNLRSSNVFLIINYHYTCNLVTLVSSRQFVMSRGCCVFKERMEDIHVKNVTVILNPHYFMAEDTYIIITCKLSIIAYLIVL